MIAKSSSADGVRFRAATERPATSASRARAGTPARASSSTTTRRAKRSPRTLLAPARRRAKTSRSARRYRAARRHRRGARECCGGVAARAMRERRGLPRVCGRSPCSPRAASAACSGTPPTIRHLTGDGARHRAAERRGRRRAPRLCADPPDHPVLGRSRAAASSSPNRCAARAPCCWTRTGARFCNELLPRDVVTGDIRAQMTQGRHRPRLAGYAPRRRTGACASTSPPSAPAAARRGTTRSPRPSPSCPPSTTSWAGSEVDLERAARACPACSPRAKPPATACTAKTASPATPCSKASSGRSARRSAMAASATECNESRTPASASVRLPQPRRRCGQEDAKNIREEAETGGIPLIDDSHA